MRSCLSLIATRRSRVPLLAGTRVRVVSAPGDEAAVHSSRSRAEFIFTVLGRRGAFRYHSNINLQSRRTPRPADRLQIGGSFVCHKVFASGEKFYVEHSRTLQLNRAAYQLCQAIQAVLETLDVHLQAGQLIQLHAATKSLTDRLNNLVRELK